MQTLIGISNSSYNANGPEISKYASQSLGSAHMNITYLNPCDKWVTKIPKQKKNFLQLRQ